MLKIALMPEYTVHMYAYHRLTTSFQPPPPKVMQLTSRVRSGHKPRNIIRVPVPVGLFAGTQLLVSTTGQSMQECVYSTVNCGEAVVQ